VLLPILFQVKDIGSEPLDGDTLPVMDLFLMPELARSLKADGWAARVWARGDGKPARISVAKPGWMVVVRFDRLEFTPKLPESTWEPHDGAGWGCLEADPVTYQQLLGTVVK